MKRLIVSAILVSVFFIGVSGLIENASANLVRDDKSLELIKAARTAIGGDQNLAQVRSMSIKAATTHFFEKDGVQDVKQGGLEINFQMPGKFSKRVKMGTPGNETTDDIVGHDVDVTVRDGDALVHADDKENVFVIRKGDGKDIEWVSKDDGNVEFKDGKILVKKDDGTVEEIKTDGKHKIRVHMDKDKDVEFSDADENTWVSDDGKRIEIKREQVSGPHQGSSEMLRTTMALLMTAPDDGSVSYKYLGEGNVDGYPSNIIEVGQRGGSFKLYLDASTNMPQMVSYEARGHKVMHFSRADGDKTVVEKLHREMKTDATKSHIKEVRFSDFRSVGGLMLPHRWTESLNGKSVQNIDITGYEINPTNIDERFGGGHGEGKVMIRKKMKKDHD